MKYSDLISENRNMINKLKGPRFDIAVLTNIMVPQIKDIAEYSLRLDGINAFVTIGDYDNILQDIEKYSHFNCIIVFWELSNLISGFQYKSLLLNNKEVRDMIDSVKNQIEFVFSELKNTPIVLFNKFSTLVFNRYEIRKNQFDYICDELNQYLITQKQHNIFLVDIDKVIAENSIDKSVDYRFFYSSKALYTVVFFNSYVEHIKPLILSLQGKSKKVIVFDCDNTLWKGILGEDGYDKIEMSEDTTNGCFFEEVQFLSVFLNKQGVLLCLCSKNNQIEVDEVIQTHPRMVIKDDHIIIKKVNWIDKAENIKSIVKELNIGLDSVVFIDDSDFEIDYIKETLPEVVSWKVPNNLYEYPLKFRKNFRYFFTLSTSDEDTNRTLMYKQQIQRDELKNNLSNIEEYLRTLNLEIIIFIDALPLCNRISQLTQKTNQFNLTTQRYSDADIMHFMKSSDYRVYSFEVTDRFGTYGVVGLMILKIDKKNSSVFIDSFLMSCRVIGRKIEYAFFDYLMKDLRSMDIREVFAKYSMTKKNEQVKDFYDSLGFDISLRNNDEKNYHLYLEKYIFKNINYIGIKNG